MKARELKAIEWRGDAESGVLLLLDQRRLPDEERWIELRTASETAGAIRDMIVRGAPAIGITAAYGMVLAAAEAARAHRCEWERLAFLNRASLELGSARPTAVNLSWALEGAQRTIDRDPSPSALLHFARAVHAEDVEANIRIGELAAAHIEQGMGILTHCNAGVLATGGMGTALSGIFIAHERGRAVHVYVDETRPRLQGARLTAWELARVGVPHTLICDGAAASLMSRGKIQLCITGADRIAANGDTANKIGTYSLAVNAAYHRIPFLVAAPSSTFDLTAEDGSRIPIEERSEAEVWAWGEGRTCPEETGVYNPAFDVTPASLIRSLVTERGEITPVRREVISEVLSRHREMTTDTKPGKRG